MCVFDLGFRHFNILLLAHLLCNKNDASLMANQGKDPAAVFNNLPGRHSDHFCIKLYKNMFVVCVFDLGFWHCTIFTLVQPLCNKTIASLMANQGEDPAAAYKNLPGRQRQSGFFCGQSTVPSLYSSLLQFMAYSFQAKQFMIIV